jgi:hypothetical protein
MHRPESGQLATAGRQHVAGEVTRGCRSLGGVALALHAGADVIADLQLVNAVNMLKVQAAVADERAAAELADDPQAKAVITPSSPSSAAISSRSAPVISRKASRAAVGNRIKARLPRARSHQQPLPTSPMANQLKTGQAVAK